MYSTTTHSIVI